MNEQLIEQGVKLILQGIGEDITREGLVETPKRVTKYYKQLFGGYEIDPKQYLKIFNEPNIKDKNMVVVESPIYSFCEHHMALFHGHVYIGYIPHEKVIGISKLVRIARVFAKRLQIQERLTAQIADFLQEHLSPLGVAVYIKAEHSCMAIRGVRTPGSKTITTSLKGLFKTDAIVRQEFMTYISMESNK